MWTCLYVLTVYDNLASQGDNLASNGTASRSQGPEGQFRSLWTKDRSVPFYLRRRPVYVQMYFMWYIVHVMCSLSNHLLVVDYLFLGSSSGVDKGIALA